MVPGNHMLNLLLDRPFGLHQLPHNDAYLLAKLDANAEATRGTDRDLHTAVGKERNRHSQ